MEQQEPKKYHTYVSFDVSSEFYRQDAADCQSQALQFAGLVAESGTELYATRGFKAGSTFMLWIRAATPEYAGELLGRLLRAQLGRYLNIVHTYFGMTRASQYGGSAGRTGQDMEDHSERLPYLIIYPFTKTVEWHLIPLEERRSIMGGHIKVGVQHRSVRQSLLYAYGVDDHEFIVSYETPSLEDFQELIMELRPTEARRYTLNDTPIHACIHKTPEEFAAWL